MTTTNVKTTTTNAITLATVSATPFTFSAKNAVLPVLPNQIKWLNYAQAVYNITIKTVITNRQEASNLIAKIQTAINNGTTTKKVVQPKPNTVAPVQRVEQVHYAVIKIDGVVSIKSFIGTGKSAQVKAEKLYHGNILMLTHDITTAIDYARKNTIVEPVATTEEAIDLTILTVKELKLLATDMNVSLKGCNVKSLMIAKLEQALNVA